MIRNVIAAAVVAFPLAAQAQHAGPAHTPGMSHGDHGAMSEAVAAGRPTEPGQSAFAAIQEIVSILYADPNTDWLKVDIAALRRHLVDMNNVTLLAAVATTPVENGFRYDVTGSGAVRDSIRRMVKAHAETMNGFNGMTILAEDRPDGAAMTVTVDDPMERAKLTGLGFFGVLTLGMHHQEHHLMIASGRAPHR